jgi:hypothetical protein
VGEELGISWQKITITSSMAVENILNLVENRKSGSMSIIYGDQYELILEGFLCNPVKMAKI